MSVVLANPLVLFASYIIPLILGYYFCLKWGANRGAALGAIPTVIVVFILFFLQVSPGVRPDGTGRLASAVSYMISEGIFWIASFLVGLAIASVQRKLRGGQR